MAKTGEDAIDIPSELLQLCPKTLPTLLVCPECSVVASTWRKDRKFDWGRVLYCTCGKDWVVCAECRMSEVRMQSKNAVRQHNKNCHAVPSLLKRERLKEKEQVVLKKPRRDTVDKEQDITTEEEGEQMCWVVTRNSPLKVRGTECLLFGTTDVDDGNKTITKRTLFRHHDDDSVKVSSSLRDFGNVNSSSYFNSDINGSGLADVVARCQFDMADVGRELHPADVQYTTDLANFAHGLTRTQRENLANILKSTISKIKRDADSNACWKTNIPTTPEMLRSQFWEGRQSFLENIPYPTVERIGSHAYCSLRACIRDRLAFGFPLEKVELRSESDQNPVRTTMQSKDSQRKLSVCRVRYDEPVLVLFLKEWQDGYDPHRFSKANRGSCWIKVITIAEPHDHRNSPEVCKWRMKNRRL